MFLLRLIALLILLACCGIGPGWIALRKLRLSPAEKIAATPLASLVFIYLIGFVLYAIDAPIAAYFAVSILCAVLTIYSVPTIGRKIRYRWPRSIVRAQLLVALGAAVMLLMVRGYGGGTWSGDWIEQYQRSGFFLHNPAYSGNFHFIGLYPLATRPPMMNIIAAFFLRQVGQRYEFFHVIYFAVSMLAFSASVLLLRCFVPRAPRWTFLLAGLFLVNPSFLENATFAWTKLPAAAFVVTGIALYVRAIGRRDPTRVALAFAFLSAGLAVHWLALPYLVLVILHALATRIWNFARFAREAATTAILMAVVLGPWMAWIVHHSGATQAVKVNPTVAESTDRSASEFVQRTSFNLIDSIVPHPLHSRDAGRIAQQSSLGAVRDYCFLMYQTTLPMMMGSIGGLIAIWRFFAVIGGGKSRANAARWFWIYLVPPAILIGIAVNPERAATTGLAQITLGPLALAGLAFIAAQHRRIPMWARRLWLAGCAVDAALGVILQFFLENRPMRVLALDANAAHPDLRTDTDLSWTSTANWLAKVQHHTIFLGDHLANLSAVLQAAAIVVEIAALALIARWLLAKTSRRSSTTPMVAAAAASSEPALRRSTEAPCCC